MKKLVLMAFLGLAACTANKSDTTSQAQDSSEVNDEFVEYLDLLPKLTLPYETDCDKCCGQTEIDYGNDLILKFQPEGMTVIGLVNRTDERAVILVTYAADFVVPMIKVYDMKGNLTADMGFMNGFCGESPGSSEKIYFRIGADLLLSQIDTTYHMNIDSIDEHTLDTASIQITRNDYRINSKG